MPIVEVKIDPTLPKVKELHGKVLQIRDELTIDRAGLAPPIMYPYLTERVKEMEEARKELNALGFTDALDGSLIEL